jgi:hypothetical protein
MLFNGRAASAIGRAHNRLQKVCKIQLPEQEQTKQAAAQSRTNSVGRI